MLQSIFNSLFGCTHQHTTFPQTPGRRSAAVPHPGITRNGTYVVCLDCGREFAYNWKEMKIGEPVNLRVATGTVQPQFR